MRTTNDSVYFWGGIYSQWYKCKFIIDGIEYNSAEQYMMAQKARLFPGNEDILEMILSTSDPKRQKELGRQVRGFDTKVWNDVCRDYVVNGNVAKFDQNPHLKAALLLTGDREMVEASPLDKIWGIGLHYDDDAVLDKSKWQGTNWLGEAIMEARALIKSNEYII